MGPPDPPPAGSEVELIHIDERVPFANAHVADVRGPELALGGCPATIEADSITIRWWDDSDAAWETRAAVEHVDPASGHLALKMVEGWRPAVLRRATRVDAGREELVLLTLGGDGRVIRETNVLCLDMSTIGCRVTGTGPRLAAGDLVQVAGPHALATPVDARIVRCDAASFGGWNAGIEFLPHSAADRAALLAWRDDAAARSRG